MRELIHFLLILLIIRPGRSQNNLIQNLEPGTPDDRVTDGFNCSTESHPYMVRVYEHTNDTHWEPVCGGSLLSYYFVLTAAHCAVHSKRYGIRYQLSHEPSDIVRVIRALPHPKYNVDNSRFNDIALMQLERPVTPSAHVNFVKLPQSVTGRDVRPCPVALIMGYGESATGGMVDDRNLKCAKIQVISFHHCLNYYWRDPPHVPHESVCVYSPTGRAACNGDGGGPLMCNDIQVGVFAFGPPCPIHSKTPSVYTKVDRYLDFIRVFQEIFGPRSASDGADSAAAAASLGFKVSLLICNVFLLID